MHVNEAKDVLVSEIARQARLEGVPFSDLERRMLYFTEEGNCPEDPFQLNDDFEAAYDTQEYEKKIAGLAKRAYKRLKKDNVSDAESWDEALRELKKGDHYILVVSPATSRRERLPWVVWITIVPSLLLVIAGLIFIGILEHYDFHILSRSVSRRGIPYSGTYAHVPVWIQRSVLAMLLAGYIYATLPSTRVDQLQAALRKIAGTFRKR
jgi:hypothetical protein